MNIKVQNENPFKEIRKMAMPGVRLVFCTHPSESKNDMFYAVKNVKPFSFALILRRLMQKKRFKRKP